MTKFIAHRGSSKEAKQNTIAAFQRASKSDVYGVETDVRITKDGVFVAFHDKSMARLSGRYRIIEKTDFKNVQKLKVFDRYKRHKIPTLLEFLQNCESSGKTAVIEIKSALTKEQTDNLIDVIASEGYLSKTIFISFKVVYPCLIIRLIWSIVIHSHLQIYSCRLSPLDLSQPHEPSLLSV